MNFKTELKKILGPSMKELVEKGDFIQARRMVMMSWIGMFCVGFVIGITFARAGWV